VWSEVNQNPGSAQAVCCVDVQFIKLSAPAYILAVFGHKSAVEVGRCQFDSPACLTCVLSASVKFYNMNILIEDAETQEYLAGDGHWTKRPDEGASFATSRGAYTAAKR
jgi:hypothetical protein